MLLIFYVCLQLWLTVMTIVCSHRVPTQFVYSVFSNLDSVVASGLNQSITGVGLDTLEEQEEKEIFFAKLEQEASSTIDYSRLNKELDSNDSIILAPFVR